MKLLHLIAAMSLAGCTAADPLPATAPTESASNDETSLVGVASVIDGDTIEIHGERIRLDGIDAPEEGSRCASGENAYQQAALTLSDIIGQQTVQCSVSGQDRYDRHIAQCSVADSDIGMAMVERGWARDWPRYSNRRYAAAEQQARAANAGIWALDCPVWGDRNYD